MPTILYLTAHLKAKRVRHLRSNFLAHQKQLRLIQWLRTHMTVKFKWFHNSSIIWVRKSSNKSGQQNALFRFLYFPSKLGSKHSCTLLCYLLRTERTRVQIPARERIINPNKKELIAQIRIPSKCGSMKVDHGDHGCPFVADTNWTSIRAPISREKVSRVQYMNSCPHRRSSRICNIICV